MIINMTYEQQLTWIAQRFDLNDDQVFTFSMQLHLEALRQGVFVFEVAAKLIDAIRYQDSDKPVETKESNGERHTKYIEQARDITVDITNTDGWDLNAVERLVAEHLYDFALLVQKP